MPSQNQIRNARIRAKRVEDDTAVEDPQQALTPEDPQQALTPEKPVEEPAPEPVAEAPKPTAVPTSVPPPPNEVIAEAKLPSKGRFYTGFGEIVKLRPMTGRDEALVAGMDAAEMIEVFDLLLTRCLRTDGLEVADMLSTDKFYLMLLLRANSYGGHYEFRARCPNCGLFQQKGCEIPDDFEMMWFDHEDEEPFSVKLPRCQKTVQFRLLRGKDEKEIVTYRDRALEKGRVQFGDPSYVYRMAKHIVSIEGESPENIGESMRFFENLIAGDASDFANAIGRYTSGVNTELTVLCSKCKTQFKVDMPITAGFFRSQLEGA